MHISCGTLVGLLGSSLSDGAHGNNTGHRTFLPMPKRGGKYKWALQGRAEKIIKVPEYVSLHMTGFPETPTVPDAQTSYSSSAIYVIACALFAPGKSRVTWVKERACAITVFGGWFAATCYHTVLNSAFSGLSQLSAEVVLQSNKGFVKPIVSAALSASPLQRWELQPCRLAGKMISSRKVQIFANKGKTWPNQIWLLHLVLDCWQWCSDTEVLACGIQGLYFQRWGLCLLEGWESRMLPTLSWETVWDEASFIVFLD